MLVVFEVLITAVCIGCTGPEALKGRLCGFAIVCACTLATLLTSLQWVSSKMWSSVFGGYAVTYLLQYLDLVLLDRWSVDVRGPVSSRLPVNTSFGQSSVAVAGVAARKPGTTSGNTIWQKICFGVSVCLNPRKIGTPYQVKNVPSWSAISPRHPPSKQIFLRRTAAIALISYLIVDVCSLGAQPDQNTVLFSASEVAFFSRWSSLNLQNVAIRLASSLLLWVNIWCLFRIFHGLVAIVSVILGIYNVEEWPPPFGSIKEAYSIRRFWG